jgi:hypothetical protein
MVPVAPMIRKAPECAITCLDYIKCYQTKMGIVKFCLQNRNLPLRNQVPVLQTDYADNARKLYFFGPLCSRWMDTN